MNEKNHNFEASLSRLEQIVRELEQGDIALEDSLSLFQEGTELVRSCQTLLDEAELQVKKVHAGADGRPIEGELIDDPES